MRLAFNAQLLSYDRSYRNAGISRYIDRTLAHLPAHLAPGDSARVFVGPGVTRDAPAVSWARVERTRIPTHRPPARILWEQVILPMALRAVPADLLHCPAYAVPLAHFGSTVVTFHDLSFLLLPEAFNPPNRLYLRTFARLAARRATRIIAVSANTRRDAVRLLGARPEAVDVIPNGVDAQFRPEPDPEVVRRFRAARGLPDRFILFLGTLEPRKNLPALLRAYAVARRQGIAEPLLLAGGPGWGDLRLAKLADELDLRSSVRPVGFVDPGEQALWYNAATLFAYPSRYEGFGIPPLEAMACGTAVVASNRSSLPEVVGDAGVLVDPDDPHQFAAAILRLLRDEDLREELAARGIERARRFSWDAAAEATLQTYRLALNPSEVAPVGPRGRTPGDRVDS
jgi:glycosyltransferase involved in cell wall biosynthesis